MDQPRTASRFRSKAEEYLLYNFHQPDELARRTDLLRSTQALLGGVFGPSTTSDLFWDGARPVRKGRSHAWKKRKESRHNKVPELILL